MTIRRILPGAWLGVAGATFLAGGFSVFASVQDQATATVVLGAAREALGGDAALSAIATLSVKGSRTLTPAPNVSTSESVEYSIAFPDRFVELRQQTSNLGPLGMSSTTARHGFAADDLINDTERDSPLPTPIIAGPNRPDQDQLRLFNLQKRLFVRLTLPLFAASFSASPLTLTALGRAAGPSGPSDVIEAKAADGFTWHLFFDAGTHRIAGISWMDKPIVFRGGTTSTIVAVPRNGHGGAVTSTGPPAVIPGNTAADQPDVQWQTTISDYRVADGLTWPHRMTTSFGGRKYEDLKLGAFKINPKIDARVFRVR